jgi:two-component system, sensor histidine kinase and response regulator
MKHTILCVDDETDNLDALERLFRTKYTVLKAESGPAALKILDQHPEPISVIITDQRMPEMSGVQFLEKSMATHPDSVRILLTGYTDIESIIQAVNSGQIYRYLNKPWDVVDLLATVERAVEKFLLTAELKQKNQDLSRALTDLQTLDDAKNRFMILINHELKTPLTSILSFTQLLSETRLDEEQEVCLKRIEKGANRLKTLVDDALIVVQGETGTLKPKITQFDCQNFHIPISQDAHNMADQKRLKTILRWVDKKIVCDPDLIQQVFSRLVHNAVKFANDNTQIVVAATLTQPHRVKFAVTNQGPTISRSVIDKIMKPFFLDEDVMHHSTGLGLGLTICQSILKAHSSKIDIQNENTGVEVSFELPCI